MAHAADDPLEKPPPAPPGGRVQGARSALGPCPFGFMAPVLGVTFGLAKTTPVFAFGVLALFGLGHCAVIGLAGFSSTWVQRWLSWQEETPGAKWLRRGCGLLVLAAGAWFILGPF